MQDKVEFSFGWLALKLLGKSLYSNAWSAISELVANGFDAKASKVYVYIDAIDKSNATIEIIDNGSGMDSAGLSVYAQVGFNRRTKIPSKKNDSIMGRKGIGKLAALYLSEKYIIMTKTQAENSAWEMNYIENADNQDEKPFLHLMNPSDVNIERADIWNNIKSGTLIQLKEVNLTGLGEEAYTSLNKKLSNYFALDNMNKRTIYFNIKERPSDSSKFVIVKKEIAFKNMAFIEYNTSSISSTINQELEKAKNTVIKMKYQKIKGNYFYDHAIDVANFTSDKKNPISGSFIYVNKEGKTIKKDYELTGWIGLHSSIDKKTASNNDERFSKSKFYNPIQLRLYVRNKLAIENFLVVINNTQAFLNYIEGEIHFDLLDDDDLPDIATTNRQSIDEHDARIELLSSIVSRIITRLITKRDALTEKMKEEEKKIRIDQLTTAKKNFADATNTEIEKYDALTPSQKSELALVITNKIEGDVSPKNDFNLFFSHAREDKIITDFFYQLLKQKGVQDNEIFYTSRGDSATQYDNLESLSIQIKECIIKQNTLLIYFTSKAYKTSEYCMFEGGAGWATRAIGEYFVISLTYKEIPKFITNGKLEICIEQDKNIVLNRELYLVLCNLLNRMIRHINKGRQYANETIIEEIDIPSIPNDLELSKAGKSIKDYMDKEFKEYWNYYINKSLNAYMANRHQ